jgi:cell division septal protein FtsQ
VYATTDQWLVYLGHEGDAARKVAIMISLVQQLEGSRQRVAYIDLRNEHRPVYKRQ